MELRLADIPDDDSADPMEDLSVEERVRMQLLDESVTNLQYLFYWNRYGKDPAEDVLSGGPQFPQELQTATQEFRRRQMLRVFSGEGDH